MPTEERALVNNRFKSRQPVDWRFELSVPYLTRFSRCTSNVEHRHSITRQPPVAECFWWRTNGFGVWVCRSTANGTIYVSVCRFCRIVRTFYYYHFCLISAFSRSFSLPLVACSCSLLSSLCLAVYFVWFRIERVRWSNFFLVQHATSAQIHRRRCRCHHRRPFVECIRNAFEIKRDGNNSK